MERFHHKSTEPAKRLAKNLKGELERIGMKAQLGQCQQLIAVMLGYATWQELVEKTTTATPSLDDDVAGPEIARRRHDQHVRVLVGAGLASTKAAAIVDALHPTNLRPSIDQSWRPHLDGEVCVYDGRAFWVGPNQYKGRSGGLGIGISFRRTGEINTEGPMTDFCIRYGSIAADGSIDLHLNVSARAAESMEAGKLEAEDLIRAMRLQKREEPGLRRSEVSSAGIDTPWGEPDKVLDYGRGVIQVSTPSHGGFRVPWSVVQTMHPALWHHPDEEGFCWYEEDAEWSLVALGLPDLFTSVEVEDAHSAASNSCYEAYDWLRREPKPSKRTMADMKRWFKDRQESNSALRRGL